MNITDRELHREIREFDERQKLNIAPEMFFLWEYKFANTDGSRNSLFNILKSDNVYLKLADSQIRNINETDSDEFFFMVSLYKESNKKLSNFCLFTVVPFLVFSIFIPPKLLFFVKSHSGINMLPFSSLIAS